MDVGFQSTIDYGGVGRFTTELLRELGPLCEEITVYPTPISVDNPTSHPWWTDMPSNIQVKEKKGLISSLVRDSNGFRNHDVIHINYASYGFPAVMNQWINNIPFVFTHHYGGTPSEMADSLFYRIQYFIEQSVFLPLVSRTGNIVSVSNYNKNRLPDKANASIIYHGGSTSLFAQTSPDGNNELNVSTDDNIALFTGKLHGFKDGKTVLEAFELANQMTSKNIKLVLATGSGGYDADSMHDYIRKDMSFNDDITVIEDLDDSLLRSLYEISDVFVFPSYAESFGLVFLEAMEAGTPIVHSDEGAAPEIVDGAGIEIKARNPRECADAIVAIFEDGDLEERLKNRGKIRRERFSWEKAANKYYKIYQRAIDENHLLH
jgi:glycosyltransferase involved in cell wall biosynthesis